MSDTEAPLLSIIIPVFNRPKSFEEILSSLNSTIISNNYMNEVELIIIDDCSNVPIGVPELKSTYQFIRNTKNKGAPFSRGVGFSLSKGRFIHFQDSDDAVTEKWLKEIVGTLKKNYIVDMLLTARTDIDVNNKTYKFQKFFDKHFVNNEKISKRLIYRNCMGPLGGVTFSRQVLEKIEFKNMASCQDWQMYIDAIKHSKVLVSRPDIKFIFNKTGDDRISHNPRKKILGHLQLSRITSKKSIFKRNIRLFYLYTCKQHIYNKGGSILKFYKKNRIKIFATFIVISLYWRLT